MSKDNILLAALLVIATLAGVFMAAMMSPARAQQPSVTITLSPDEQNATVTQLWKCLEKEPFACADVALWLRNKIVEAQKAAKAQESK